MKKEFEFLSADGKSRVHAQEWIPDGEVRAVVQICHGMVEHIDRYDEFAKYLNAQGYYVTGHDHLGHGKTAHDQNELGHFPEKCGNQYIQSDIHSLRKITEKKYPKVPYYMLGHSMGSFLLRQYLMSKGEGLAGAVIMGTGDQPRALAAAGQIICRGIAGVKGWRCRSVFVDNLAFGGYNRKFNPKTTGKEWLSSDPKVSVKYIKDPFCSFRFTVGAYYQMFEGIKIVAGKKGAEAVPKNLPVFFVAGADDPVGAFGKGVARVYQTYKKAGIKNVSLKLYKNDRHEILNETDREQVYEDLYHWMEKSLLRKCS